MKAVIWNPNALRKIRDRRLKASTWERRCVVLSGLEAKRVASSIYYLLVIKMPIEANL
jgi:hypothetical protein